MPASRVIDKQLQAFLQRVTSRTVNAMPPDFFKLNADDNPVTWAVPTGEEEA